VVDQQYFPDGVPPDVLYEPGDLGEEASIRARLRDIDRVLRREGR
jgi:predicted fused transcriptional regulator/phosphomethylpyrimidine kinase